MARGKNWERLGDLLVSRRVELGWANREEFARARGLTHARTIFDIENKKRTNFTRATLAQVEQFYEWEPGSIAAVLIGNDPTPIEKAYAISVKNDLPTQSQMRRRIHGLIDRFDETELPRVLDKILELLDDG